MHIHRRLVFPLALTLAASGFATGCTDRPYASPQEQAANACQSLGPKTVSGGVIGGLGGAAGGAAIGGIVGGRRGAAIGAAAGGVGGIAGGLSVGHGLDRQDCAQAQSALQQIGNAPTYVPVAWSSSGTGNHGSYVPVSDVYDDNGRICRRIRADYFMRDQQPVINDSGVVCRDASGDWQRQV